MQKCVNLVDPSKSFQTTIYCKNRRRYSRVRASQSLPKISRQLRKKVRTNIGRQRAAVLHPGHVQAALLLPLPERGRLQARRQVRLRALARRVSGGAAAGRRGARRRAPMFILTPS